MDEVEPILAVGHLRQLVLLDELPDFRRTRFRLRIQLSLPIQLLIARGLFRPCFFGRALLLGLLRRLLLLAGLLLLRPFVLLLLGRTHLLFGDEAGFQQLFAKCRAHGLSCRGLPSAGVS
jgi:hypothetical protein